MTQQKQRVFDFDQWAALAREDPVGFEAKRNGMIDALIERALPEHRQRLRGLQFRVDMERRRAKSPMAACVRIQALMWDSLIGPDGFYDRVSVLSDRAGPRRLARQETPLHCAIIIPFPGTKKPLPG